MPFTDYLPVTRSYVERRLRETIGRLPKGETVQMTLEELKALQKKLSDDLKALAADQKAAFDDLKAKIDKLSTTGTTPEQQAAIDDLGASMENLDSLVHIMDGIAKASDPGTDPPPATPATSGAAVASSVPTSGTTTGS